MKKYDNWKAFAEEVRVGDVVALSANKTMIRNINQCSINLDFNMGAFETHRWGKVFWIAEDGNKFLFTNSEIGADTVFTLWIPFDAVESATIMTYNLKDLSKLKKIKTHKFGNNTVTFGVGQHVTISYSVTCTSIRRSVISHGKIVGFGDDAILYLPDGSFNSYEIIALSDIESILLPYQMNQEPEVTDLRTPQNPIKTEDLNSSYYGKFLVTDNGRFGIFVNMDDNWLYLIDQIDGGEMSTRRSMVREVYFL